MHLDDVAAYIADKGLLKYIRKVIFLFAVAIIQGISHDLQRPKQAKSRMGIVLGSLVAASVIAVFVEEIVKGNCCLFNKLSPLILSKEVLFSCEGRKQNILGYPGSPIAHRLFSVTHPPEMLSKIWLKDPVVKPLIHIAANIWTYLFKLGTKKVFSHGNKGASLRIKQVNYGPVFIRQILLFGVPYIAVVGWEAPGSLLQNKIEAI